MEECSYLHNNFVKRCVVAFIGGSLLLWLLVMQPVYYRSLLCLLALGTFYEVFYLNTYFTRKLNGFNYWQKMLAGLLFFLGSLVLTSWLLTIWGKGLTLAIGVMVCGLLLIVLSNNKITFFDVSYVFFMASYLGAGFLMLIKLGYGYKPTLLFLGSVWASDIGAYLVGTRWGRHKICPMLSPGKSIEGAIAGFVLAGIMATILQGFLQVPLALSSFAIGFLLAVAGQIGDLVASALKRSAHVKDAGKLLPGHGGLFDRFDSWIFAALLLKIVPLIKI
ncbi:MAG: hypothetical protein RLZ12_664 [Bacillota bacterium]|jgi:phosphatidate cytidylyltransferase